MSIEHEEDMEAEGFDNDRFDVELDEEEAVNYEAAKDLEASRWQGIRATCMR